MSFIQIKAQLSMDELLKAIEQLNPPELEQFLSHVVALQAKRKAPSAPQVEAELLLKINQGVPSDTQRRYDELIAKRRKETLTPDEYDDLLSMTEQIEHLEARRMEYLAEMARIRKTSLAALMESLGIRSPAYA